MTPQTTSIDMFFIFDDASSTAIIEIMAPKKAAPAIKAEPRRTAPLAARTSVTATISRAPDDMPSTNGPAIGLWK